jgi:hypothetical protein
MYECTTHQHPHLVANRRKVDFWCRSSLSPAPMFPSQPPIDSRGAACSAALCKPVVSASLTPRLSAQPIQSRCSSIPLLPPSHQSALMFFDDKTQRDSQMGGWLAAKENKLGTAASTQAGRDCLELDGVLRTSISSPIPSGDQPTTPRHTNLHDPPDGISNDRHKLH